MQRLLDPFRLDPRIGAASLRHPAQLVVRGLGLVHALAFASLWVQVHALIGHDGLLPADRIAPLAEARWGIAKFLYAPSLFWLWPGDGMLHLLCALGVGLGLVVMAGRWQGPALLGLWVSYLSLVVVGRDFLSFQWDTLLLEATFLGLFLAPWRSRAQDAGEPSPLALTMFRLLHLKLMFLSGLVKLRSGDAHWADLSALQYHYWTQPLPNPVAWYVDGLPDVVHRASVAGTFAIELVLPWLFLVPRWRWIPLAGTSLLMFLLAFTGNYGWFQVLVIVLALSLLEGPGVVSERGRGRFFVGVGATVLATLNLGVLWVTLVGTSGLPPWALRGLMRTTPWRTVNAYGLFAVMTTQRPEIVLEGTVDGQEWREYVFPYKPTVGRMPPLVAPHQPRLDWQMWFAALGTCEQNPWLPRLMQGLVDGEPQMVGLFARDPFDGETPVRVRSTVYQYTFGEHTWWQASETGYTYCPEVTVTGALSPG